MRRSGQRAIGRIVFDDPNLISPAGLVPTMAPAQEAQLVELADSHICVPTDAGARVLSLTVGMMADADCIAPMIMKEISGCAPLRATPLGGHRGTIRFLLPACSSRESSDTGNVTKH